MRNRKSVIIDAVTPGDCLTAEGVGPLLYIDSKFSGIRGTIALDIDGAKDLARALIPFLRNHPEAKR